MYYINNYNVINLIMGVWYIAYNLELTKNVIY